MKTFEKNNPTIALNILNFLKKEVYPAYISKINSKCEKQLILSMIPNEENYETVFTILEQKINLNLMKKYVRIKIFTEFQCHQKRIIY